MILSCNNYSKMGIMKWVILWDNNNNNNIGDRLSPYVSVACLFFAAANLFIREWTIFKRGKDKF